VIVRWRFTLPVKIKVRGPMYLPPNATNLAEQGMSPSSSSSMVPHREPQRCPPVRSTSEPALCRRIEQRRRSGIDIRVIAPQSENRGCAHSSTWNSYRKDLAERGAVRTPADPLGRKIALCSNAGSSEWLSDVLLRKGNLQPSDVEYVQMSFGDIGAALGGGTSDASAGRRVECQEFWFYASGDKVARAVDTERVRTEGNVY
jgi:hypothetical protein